MKFRASYSVLSCWESGDYERAARMYYKLDDFDTEAMRQGRLFHKDWETEIQQNQCLPEVFGGRELENPETELKLVRQLDDWLELVGVIDLKDGKTLYDWKTGVSLSSDYANSMQPYLYHLLAPEATRFEIHAYNQYTKQTTMSILHLSQETMSSAVDWLVLNATEMRQYLVANEGLYADNRS